LRIVVAAVGRLRKGPYPALIETYLARMTWCVDIREVQEKRPDPAGGIKAAEAALLLRALPESGPVVALDERGEDVSSRAFADLLADWRDRGEPACGFAIGGAEGLDETVRVRAVRTLRFGCATWPHMLARVMLVEQLYRAQQILAGHPYHRA